MREPGFYLAVAAASAALAAWLCSLLTPRVRELALAYSAAPAPRSRDVHVQPIPRWGGLAIFASFVIALAVLALVVSFGFGLSITDRTLRPGIALVVAGALLSAVGAIDDRTELSAGKQLIVQLICALLVIPFGVEIRFVTNPFSDGMVDLHWWSYPLTVLWLVGVANAVNFIDGIDGLAAGVSAISAATMALMAAWSNQPALALLAASLCGALLGFLRYNFNPARIFMGGGAPVVGFLLASISSVGAFKAPVAVAVAIPFLLLAIPIFDTAAVIIRRWRSGRPIYQADQGHIHHRLLALGYSQKKTVLILYGISSLFCVFAFVAFLLAGSRGN